MLSAHQPTSFDLFAFSSVVMRKGGLVATGAGAAGFPAVTDENSRRTWKPHTEGKGTTQMKRLSVPLFLAMLAVGSFAGRPARADFTYSTHASPEVFAADGGTKSVIFLLSANGAATGSSDINLTSSIGLSAVDPSTPSHFTNRAFSVALTLTDTKSHAANVFTFTGMLNGTMNHMTSALTTTYSSPTTLSATLGGLTYTVSVGSGTTPLALAPVAVFPGLYLGNMTAHVDVLSGGPTGGGGGTTPPPPSGGGGGTGGGGGGTGGGGGGTGGGGGGVSDTPEPSTLLASCIGLTCLGLAGWRKRRANVLAI
jgi:hypothetical protein